MIGSRLLVSILLAHLFTTALSVTEKKNESNKEEEPLPPPLTAGEFDEAIKHGLHIVEFFSPHCGACKNFAPTWEKTWRSFHKQGESLNITFSQVDCIASGDICMKESISYYPNIRLYNKDGMMMQYPGHFRRTESDLIKFAKESAFDNPDFDLMALDGESENISNLDMISLLSGLEDVPYLVSFWPTRKLKDMSTEVDFKNCNGCKGFQKTWDKVTKKLFLEGIYTGHFNCEEHPKFCSELGFHELADAGSNRSPKVALFLPNKDHNNLFIYKKKIDDDIDSYVDFASRTVHNNQMTQFNADDVSYLLSKSVALESSGRENNKVHIVFAYEPSSVVEEDFHILEYLLEPFSQIPNLYLYKSDANLMAKSRDALGNYYMDLLPDLEKHKNGIRPKNEEYFIMDTMTQFPTFFIFREGDRLPHVYHGYSSTEMRDQNQIVRWVKQFSMPYVNRITPSNFFEIMDRSNKEVSHLVIQFVDTSKQDQKTKDFENLKKVIEQSFEYEADRMDAVMNEINRKRTKKDKMLEKLKEEGAEFKKVNAVRNSEITHDNNKRVLWNIVDISKDFNFTSKVGLTQDNNRYQPGDIVIIDRKNYRFYDKDINGDKLSSEKPNVLKDTLVSLILPTMTKLEYIEKGYKIKKPSTKGHWQNIMDIPHIKTCIFIFFFIVLTVYFKSRGQAKNDLKFLNGANKKQKSVLPLTKQMFQD